VRLQLVFKLVDGVDRTVLAALATLQTFDVINFLFILNSFSTVHSLGTESARGTLRRKKERERRRRKYEKSREGKGQRGNERERERTQRKNVTSTTKSAG
jgi:hypothetical protein